MTGTLVLSFSTLIAAMLILWLAPTHRRQFFFGALFSVPIVGFQFLAAGTFLRLGGTVQQSWLYLVAATLFAVAGGGTIAVLVDRFISRWIAPIPHQQRHTLAWLVFGVLVAGLVLLAGRPLGLALLVGLFVNALILLFLDRALIWDAVLGAMAYSAWFGLADILFGVRASGDIQPFLFAGQPIGLTIEGLSLERVVTIVMMGALLGPLFAATKRFRSQVVAQFTGHPTMKLASGVAMVLLATAVVSWFSTTYVLPPKLLSAKPALAAEMSATTPQVVLNFSSPVNRDSFAGQFQPDVEGTWSFSDPSTSTHGFRRATFTFQNPVRETTDYVLYVSGIESVWGMNADDVSIRLTTQPPGAPIVITTTLPQPKNKPAPKPVVVPPKPVVDQTPTVQTTTVKKTMLSIALDYQDQPLSCEAAALKMALAGVGVRVSESQIMKYVGYDPTPHHGSTWGDPSVGFVGNIAGKQNTTGYGVYWDPIAKAASHWRKARVVTNSTPEKMAAEIAAGHPVVIWGTLGNAYRDDWKTPAGKKILAWKGEHARTLIGFNGPVTKPTSYIINDPIVGRVTWSRAQFDANWARFNRSAVVIE